MSGLVEFLRARYTEAREHEHRKRRGIPSAFDGHDVEIQYSADEGEQVFVDGHPYPVEKYWEIATEPAPDPAVLADLDAKLRIVKRHEGCGTGVGRCDDGGHGWDDIEGGGCADLADLAQPYADHPDYREEWKP
jgi:hypothetical protein